MTTRRKVLLGLAGAGGAAIAGGTIYSSFANDDEDGGSGSDIVLNLATDPAGTDWPWVKISKLNKAKSDPNAKAVNDALGAWLDDNPGVRFKDITLNVWDQKALVTAVSGGSGPAMFPASVLGNWNGAAIKAAYQQGLAADITELAEKYKFEDKIADFAQPHWKSLPVDGKLYSMPDSFNAGNGIFYRRDLIAKKGLKEPEPGWSWEELRALVRGLTTDRMKGAAFQKWGVDWPLKAQAWALLTRVPAPSQKWHWKYDYTTHAAAWTEAVELYRGMLYQDKSALSDSTLADGEVTSAFTQGRAALFGNNIGFFFGDPDSDNTLPNMAKRMDKPMSELVGFVPHPVGKTGYYGVSAPFMGVTAFSPDLSADALDKMVSLQDHMTYGQGYVIRKQVRWDATKNLQRVYNDPTPINGMTKIEGIDGSLEDAWGPEIVKAAQASAAMSNLPDEAAYFPAEKNAGPPNTPIEDMESHWSFEKGRVDIRGDLKKLTDTHNKQAAGFTSSVDKADFAEAAEKYYAAVKEFWQEKAPDFASEVLDPWLADVVKPSLEA
ncbi:extracellular solute-binding protein [Streptomyces sp. PSKA54]|uniref:Extracellular solute-binding protein n=1 Tax=Streptomyces himalayensis subsp. aureolus TaxID=2758039 RepID=A0A7W2D6G3_9ACTN|nr:extracellular solute-binding protein [Streptomyces himalayensis]MBA4865655.1 extracellular solute-binding protein [Streptomyces himalayensis subsp. aureolus]